MKDPENITRVIIEHESGALGFALYKDGMYLVEETKDWIVPSKVKNWISIRDIKKAMK